MNERLLYRGLNNFEGSIDGEGNLYDERHRLVGRIEGNEVYDYCNIKQGTIDESGKLWDINHTFVGEERGSNFFGPLYKSTGLVRGDSFGEGRGSEYGALMLLKKRNEWYSGNIPDRNYEFGNGNEDDDEEDGDDEEIISESNESVIEDEDPEDDAEWDDYELSQRKTPHDRDGGNGMLRSSARKPGLAHSMPTRRQERDSSYVPPDSFFSTGRRNEYRINGMTYVDVSGRSEFWTGVMSFWAGLSGKGVITGWDKMNGTWDRMKQEAYRNG